MQIGTIYDIKDLLSREGWKPILGLIGQWEEGSTFKEQSQTLPHTWAIWKRDSSV